MTAETDEVQHDHVLALAHIGDLHLTDAKQRSFTDFLSIVAQIAIEGARTIDFVVLPGDDADNGKRSQSVLGATALKMLSDESGRPGQHSIRAATPAYVPPVRARGGSDAASVGAWPENGILGTQLGPDRNGRPRS